LRNRDEAKATTRRAAFRGRALDRFYPDAGHCLGYRYRRLCGGLTLCLLKEHEMTDQQALQRRLEDLKVRFRREVIQGHPTQRLIDTIAELHRLLKNRRPKRLPKD